jgi:hypothetical protein
MTEDQESPAPEMPAPETPAAPGRPDGGASPPRRLARALLAGSGALLATTAVVAAIDPKLPPFRGD